MKAQVSLFANGLMEYSLNPKQREMDARQSAGKAEGVSDTICALLIVVKLNQLAHLLTYYNGDLQ